jgi:hypothetical protein
MKHLARTLPLITASLFQTSPAQINWQRITDQEAGFSISFPGKPTYHQLTNPITGDPTESYSFVYNGHHLQILF